MTYEEYLSSIDDSHQMTTARDHIAMLCEIVAGKEDGRLLELGSHAGISTAALAIAAPESTVVSVDLCDTVCEADRVAYWSLLGIENIQPVEDDAGRFLRRYQLGLEPWDFIFHDAAHGDAVLPEYLTAAGMCDVLAIHDWEQLSESSQIAVRSRFKIIVESHRDSRGRQMFVGMK